MKQKSLLASLFIGLALLTLSGCSAVPFDEIRPTLRSSGSPGEVEILLVCQGDFQSWPYTIKYEILPNRIDLTVKKNYFKSEIGVEQGFEVSGVGIPLIIKAPFGNYKISYVEPNGQARYLGNVTIPKKR